MTINIHALRDRRDALVADAQAIIDGKAYGLREKNRVDAMQAEIDRFNAHIRQVERLQSIEDSLTATARTLSVQNGRSVDENCSRVIEARRALRAFAVDGSGKMSEQHLRLMTPQNVAIGTNTAGGYLVPTELQYTLLQKLKAFGGVRKAATVIETAGGNPLRWATMDETGQVGEIVGEGVMASNSDLTFGQVALNAYKFSSKIVPVSFEALQDSGVDVEALMFAALATRIARVQNTFFTTGSGVGQPQGVLTAAALGVTLPAGNTTGVAYDGLIDLYHSLDPAYRFSPGCRFMMNDKTVAALQKLKDGNGRPIYLAAATEGAFTGQTVDELFGIPVVIDQDMPNLGASAKPILFGDFSKYLIRDVMQVEMLRFTDSAYLSKGQIGFLAWARADGRLIDASNESIATSPTPRPDREAVRWPGTKQRTSASQARGTRASASTGSRRRSA